MRNCLNLAAIALGSLAFFVSPSGAQDFDRRFQSLPFPVLQMTENSTYESSSLTAINLLIAHPLFTQSVQVTDRRELRNDGLQEAIRGVSPSPSRYIASGFAIGAVTAGIAGAVLTASDCREEICHADDRIAGVAAYSLGGALVGAVAGGVFYLMRR